MSYISTTINHIQSNQVLKPAKGAIFEDLVNYAIPTEGDKTDKCGDGENALSFSLIHRNSFGIQKLLYLYYAKTRHFYCL